MSSVHSSSWITEILLLIEKNIIFVAVVAIITGCFYYVKWKRHQNSIPPHGVKYPPCASAGMYECLTRIASSDVPFFLLRCAHELNAKKDTADTSYVFEIKLPNFSSLTNPLKTFVVSDAHVARHILLDKESYKPPTIYRQGVFGPSIFNAEGHRWLFARKGVAPAFSSRHINRMNQICLQKTDLWIQEVIEPSIKSNTSFDVGLELTRLTIKIIFEAAFEYNASVQEVNTFTADLEEVLRGRQKMGRNPLKLSNKFGRLFPSVRKVHATAFRVGDFALKIINNYRNNVRGKKTNNQPQEQYDDDTVISLIVNNDNYEDDNGRIADVITFLVAGHDTTAFSLSWTLIELARNPKEMKKIKDSYKQMNFQSKDEFAKSEILKNVIREGMRLHPVAALGSARSPNKNIQYTTSSVITAASTNNNSINSNNEDKISNDNHEVLTIPKDSVVFFPQYLLNRHPKYFKDPDQFIPSRWEEDGANNREEMLSAYMPFSLGRRNCVGQSLANAELHSVLARLIIDYEFTIEDEGIAEYYLTLKPKGARLKAHHSK